MIVGPIAIRLVYEGLMMGILLIKNVIQINKVVYKNNKLYFQVKNSQGKTGYIPASKSVKSMNTFKEAQFAG